MLTWIVTSDTPPGRHASSNKSVRSLVIQDWLSSGRNGALERTADIHHKGPTTTKESAKESLLVQLLDVGKVVSLKVSKHSMCILDAWYPTEYKGFPQQSLSSINFTPLRHDGQVDAEKEPGH